MIQNSNPDAPAPDEPQRSIVVDMSPEAVARRIRELGYLYELWKSFRNCRVVGLVESEQDRDG